MAEVKARRLPEVAKVEQEVKARLKKEINFWDNRAAELREDEKAGKKTRLNWQNAERRAEDLADRLKRRMELLEKERFISAQPPRVRGGMVVVPKGLLLAKAAVANGAKASAFAEDRRLDASANLRPWKRSSTPSGRWAMSRAMYRRRRLATTSLPLTLALVICVHRGQGRIDGADTVMLTRQEIITSLHEPGNTSWPSSRSRVATPRNRGMSGVRCRDHEPSFEHTAIQFNLKRLLERADQPN